MNNESNQENGGEYRLGSLVIKYVCKRMMFLFFFFFFVFLKFFFFVFIDKTIQNVRCHYQYN